MLLCAACRVWMSARFRVLQYEQEGTLNNLCSCSTLKGTRTVYQNQTMCLCVCKVSGAPKAPLVRVRPFDCSLVIYSQYGVFHLGILDLFNVVLEPGNCETRPISTVAFRTRCCAAAPVEAAAVRARAVAAGRSCALHATKNDAPSNDGMVSCCPLS